MTRIYRKINFNTEKILYYLFLSGGVIALSILAPRLPYEILKAYLRQGKVKEKKFSRSRFNRDLKRLVNHGDIEIADNKVRITQKGKTRILKFKLEEMKIKRPKRWDKKWRLVVFDIPVSQTKTGITLRRKLLDLGFLHYQKSVFIFPYSCRDEIDFMREIFELGFCVKLITATKIDDEDYFLKRFKLKAV